MNLIWIVNDCLLYLITAFSIGLKLFKIKMRIKTWTIFYKYMVTNNNWCSLLLSHPCPPATCPLLVPVVCWLNCPVIGQGFWCHTINPCTSLYLLFLKLAFILKILWFYLVQTICVHAFQSLTIPNHLYVVPIK